MAAPRKIQEVTPLEIGVSIIPAAEPSPEYLALWRLLLAAAAPVPPLPPSPTPRPPTSADGRAA